MAKAIVPFRCEVCGTRFAEKTGGACVRCRRLCCAAHLTTQPGSVTTLCTACASGAIRCERLRELGAPGIAVLVAESERAGLSLVRKLVDEWRDGSNAFDRPGEAVFGAWVDGRLAGVCGLNIDPYVCDDRVGRVRHLYVLVECRRLGVGRALMDRVIEAARGRFVTLRLSTSNPAAARLYEALGFRAVSAPHCTHLRELA